MTQHLDKAFKLFMFVAVVSFSFTVFSGTVAAFSGTGSGTSTDPYQIENWEHLDEVRDDPAAYYILQNDLDNQTANYTDFVSSPADGWNPIGAGTTTNPAFTGTFDGRGHTIDGLYIEHPSVSLNGLFGYIGTGGEVKYLGVTNVNLTGYNKMGGLAGRNNGLIENTFTTGVVDGRERTGGLVGHQDGGTIKNSYSGTEVISDHEKIGGLVGDNSNSDIYKSYSYGIVDQANTGATVGGLTGREDGTTIVEDSFWDTEASGQSTSPKGTGKTTAEMKNVSTFTDTATTGLTNPWHFVDDPNDDTSREEIWGIDTSINDGYPHLQPPTLPHVIMNEGTTNEYKLYIYPLETLTTHVWGGHNAGSVGADSFTDGGGNTEAIVDAFGEAEPYAGATDYAAKVTEEKNAYYYRDWFLPARDQLERISTGSINKGTYADEWQSFANDLYWSSTEGTGDAYFFNMGTSSSGTANKDNAYYVRPVRVEWSLGLNSPADGSTDVKLPPDLNVEVASPTGNDIAADFYEVTGWDLTTAVDTGKTAPTQDTGPEGVHFKPDGTMMYVMGYSDEATYQFSLSTPWDISTATYEKQRVNINANSADLFIGPNGTRLYELEMADGQIHVDMMSTAWDIGSADSIAEATISTQSTDPEDIHFGPDGTKMYELGASSTVYEYDLSTPWDINSATYNTENVGLSSSGATGLHFHPDGDKMYVINGDGDAQVHQYSLSTAWNLSTATYDSIDSPAVSPGDPHSLFFKPTGGQMYFVSRGGEQVHQYSLDTSGELINNVSSVGSGTDATHSWQAADTFRYYEWFLSVDDGSTSAISDIWGFMTGEESSSSVDNISVTTQPDTLTYDSGDTLDLTGMKIEESLSDGTTNTVTFDDSTWNTEYTATPSNGTTLDEDDHGTTITITHTNTQETTNTNTLKIITVVESINITTQPTHLTYDSGDTLNLSGIEAQLNWTDDTTDEHISYKNFTTNGLTATPDQGDALDENNDNHPITITHTDTQETADTNTLTVEGSDDGGTTSDEEDTSTSSGGGSIDSSDTSDPEILDETVKEPVEYRPGSQIPVVFRVENESRLEAVNAILDRGDGWEALPLTQNGSRYRATFTPQEAGVYQVQMTAAYTDGRTGTYTKNLAVRYDRGWAMGASTLGNIDGSIYRKHIQLPNLTLHNTGSKPANISLTFQADPLLVFSTPEHIVIDANTSRTIPVTVRLTKTSANSQLVPISLAFQATPLMAFSAPGQIMLAANTSAGNAGRYPFTVTARPVDSRSEPVMMNASGTAVFTQEAPRIVTERIETATEEVSGRQRQRVMATVTNLGSAPADDAWIMFDIPTGWTVINGDANVSVGTLRSGKQRQVNLTLEPSGIIAGPSRIKLHTGSAASIETITTEHSLPLTTDNDRLKQIFYPILIFLAVIGILTGLYLYRFTDA